MVCCRPPGSCSCVRLSGRFKIGHRADNRPPPAGVSGVCRDGEAAAESQGSQTSHVTQRSRDCPGGSTVPCHHMLTPPLGVRLGLGHDIGAGAAGGASSHDDGGRPRAEPARYRLMALRLPLNDFRVRSPLPHGERLWHSCQPASPSGIFPISCPGLAAETCLTSWPLSKGDLNGPDSPTIRHTGPRQANVNTGVSRSALCE